MTETFYELLGVPEDASTAEIETAYRECVKEVHPDVSDDVDASERTKRLNRAKRVLTDRTERARYDRLGHEAYTDDGPGTDDSPSGGAGDRDDSGSGSPSSGGRDWRTRHAGRRGRHRTDDWATGGQTDDWATGDATGAAGPGAAGPSAASSGPSWQSRGGAASASAAGGGVESPSARRQAAAGSTDGPNVDWSWNGWERTRSWAVRQGGSTRRGLYPSRLFPPEQPVVLVASTFLLYPFFIATILFPPFPVVVRATVAVCTLLMFAYLLSIPEVAVLVYGAWSLLVPLAVVLVPGVGLFSLAAVVGLSVTWVPFGLSVLTLSIVRP